MSHNGTTILTKQNESSNIKALAAQRQLYSKAKALFYVQLVLAVPVPVLIATLQVIFPEHTAPYVWIATLYGIIAIISELILDGIISATKKRAAGIQELFDHNVLGISWNRTLVKSKPDNEVVFRHFRHYDKRHSLTNLYDWYSLRIKPTSSNIATVICQRTNCTYDFVLRRRFNLVVICSVVLTLLMLIIAAASIEITVAKFILNVIVPASPIFIVAVRQIRSNDESIENLTNLKEQLEGILENATATTHVDEVSIRQIQDRIYLNRVNSSLLPDFVFNLLRPNLEEEMNFSVQELVNKL